MVLAVALVATGGLVVHHLLSAVDCSQLARGDAAVAADLAVACGKDVEVTAERSPWITVFAQPDGDSRMTVDALPKRTNAHGKWEPVSTKVLSRPQVASAAGGAGSASSGSGVSQSRSFMQDISSPPGVTGMLPVAAPVYPMWFNPGGVEGVGLPVGVVERDGAWVKLWFPLELPVPTVDGRFVSYQLAAGVKLVVSVESDGSGFRPIVELASAEAAGWFRDALSQVRAAKGLPGSGWEIPYRVEASEGLVLQDTGGAGFELLNADGESEPSQVWCRILLS